MVLKNYGVGHAKDGRVIFWQIDEQQQVRTGKMMKYMEDKVAKEDKVFDDPTLMKTPVVRNGKQATVGYCPEIWETWE